MHTCTHVHVVPKFLLAVLFLQLDKIKIYERQIMKLSEIQLNTVFANTHSSAVLRVSEMIAHAQVSYIKLGSFDIHVKVACVQHSQVWSICPIHFSRSVK